MMAPHARKEGFVVRKLAHQILVYDTERHRAHCLIDRADSCRSGGNMRAHRRVRRPARRDALRPPLHEDLSIWRLLLTAARRDAPLWRVADASDSAPPLARG